MSRQSESSTRLPPRKVAPKKRTGKQSKVGRRKMVERENAERERLNVEIETCTEKLISLLVDGGVSEPCLGELKKDLSQRERDNFSDEQALASLKRADSAVEKSWTFASCFPEM